MNLITSVVHKISEYIPLIHREKKVDPIPVADMGSKNGTNHSQATKKRSKPKKQAKNLANNQLKKQQTTHSKKKEKTNVINAKVSGKKAIPKTIRNQVWRRFCGDRLDAKCFCCAQSLAYESWEAGHVLSEAKGGKSVIDNLRPICLPCNRSMGTKHMFEFMKEYQLSGLKNIK